MQKSKYDKPENVRKRNKEYIKRMTEKIGYIGVFGYLIMKWQKKNSESF